MKKLVYIASLSMLLFSCGGKTESVDSVIETNDITKIRAKREEVQAEYEKLTADLARIDAAID